METLLNHSDWCDLLEIIEKSEVSSNPCDLDEPVAMEDEKVSRPEFLRMSLSLSKQ